MITVRKKRQKASRLGRSLFVLIKLMDDERDENAGQRADEHFDRLVAQQRFQFADTLVFFFFMPMGSFIDERLKIADELIQYGGVFSSFAADAQSIEHRDDAEDKGDRKRNGIDAFDDSDRCRQCTYGC